MFIKQRSSSQDSASKRSSNHSTESSQDPTQLILFDNIKQITPNLTDLELIRALPQSKFPVFMVQSKSNHQEKFILKLFPYKNGQPHYLFKNEAKRSHLQSKYIMKTRKICFQAKMPINQRMTSVSYIIQEYADNGDLFDLINQCKVGSDEKLIRTFFHRLIQGLEFLHKRNNIAHLDIKLENLLLDKDFNLKITDFDLSRSLDEVITNPVGSPVYRPYEFRVGKSNQLAAGDIYSCGILLFTLKFGGVLPYLEDTKNRKYGEDLQNAMNDEPHKFWEFHHRFNKFDQSLFSQDFKQLFQALVQRDPSKRPSLKEIKTYKWYKGETYSASELKIHPLLVNYASQRNTLNNNQV